LYRRFTQYIEYCKSHLPSRDAQQQSRGAFSLLGQDVQGAGKSDIQRVATRVSEVIRTSCQHTECPGEQKYSLTKNITDPRQHVGSGTKPERIKEEAGKIHISTYQLPRPTQPYASWVGGGRPWGPEERHK